MRRRLSEKLKAGFTLVEMLVLLAIIAVLVTVAMPVFARQVDKARLSVCLANRRSLQTELVITSMLEELDQSKADLIVVSFGEICPKGGVISVSLDDGITIKCSIHDDAGGVLTASQSYLDTFKAFADGKNLSNDTLRRNFFADSGNAWPTLSIGNKVYQIEPYYAGNTGECWLFARAQTEVPNVVSNWYVPLIYVPSSGQWYEYQKTNGTQNRTSVNYTSLDNLQVKLAKTGSDGSAWHLLPAEQYTIQGLQ